MPRNCEILTYLLIYSNKLAYLQLITVLGYGNSSPKSHEQDYLNFQQKLWKIIEFIFRRCNFTKNELFLRYYLRILFSEDFFYHGTSMLLQNTSLYICGNSKYAERSLCKIIQNYVNNKINNFNFLTIFYYKPWSNITPLYFFSSNIIYFCQKQPIKVQIF